MIVEDRKFDLESRLVKFAVSIMNIVESLPDNRIGNHVAGQLVRSGTSPAPNYGEACSAESRRDFIHKMKIALKELRETRIWLMIIEQKKLVASLPVIRASLSECLELIKIFSRSIKTAGTAIK